MKEEFIELKLPLPVSVNEAYSGYPKRHKSDKYLLWIDLAEIEMRKQTTFTIKWSNWLEAILTFYFPLYNKDWTHKKKDLDNFFKTLFDFLWDNITGFEDKNIKIICQDTIKEKYL